MKRTPARFHTKVPRRWEPQQAPVARRRGRARATGPVSVRRTTGPSASQSFGPEDSSKFEYQVMQVTRIRVTRRVSMNRVSASM